MKAKRPVLKWLEKNGHHIVRLEGCSNYTVLHYDDGTKEVISYPNRLILPFTNKLIQVRRATHIKEELIQINQFSKRLKRKYKNEKANSIITNTHRNCA